MALTRPQMFAGVTYSYFVANVVIGTELFLIFKSIWVVASALLLHGTGVLLCLGTALLRSVARARLQVSAYQELPGVGMQLLPPLTTKASAAAREPPSGRHLPYARHVDDHTIETRDALMMQVIQVRGLLFETADTAEINYRKRFRVAALQAIGSSRFAVYHHIIRREAEVSLNCEYPDVQWPPT